MESLFENAAAGMFNLIFSAEPKSLLIDQTETISLSEIDAEMLLVSWLSELLWHFDTNLMVPTTYDLNIEEASCSDGQGLGEASLEAKVGFVRLSDLDLSPTTDVKAVTMHNLAIKRERGMLSVRVLLDV